jgi:rRNA processing protein Krr1/Pno1
MKIVRIPQERVGALIGKKGEEKRLLEERTGVVIDVDSESGEVTINCQKAKNPGPSGVGSLPTRPTSY